MTTHFQSKGEDAEPGWKFKGQVKGVQIASDSFIAMQL